jgi:sporulation integral membrane protein YlbJ
MKNINFWIKQIFIYAFPFMAVILCLFAKETSQVAKNAIYLCLDIVIPSLFPFFVLSKIIVPYISRLPCPGFLKGFIERVFHLPYYTIIIILLGFMSGYPSGAKMTRDLFDQKLLNSKQASKLLPMANNCSPLFIIGTIGAGLFKSIKLGAFLLLIHLISGIMAALITGKLVNSFDSGRKDNKNNVQEVRRYNHGNLKRNTDPPGLSSLVTASIEEAAILCIKVSGYIVFFAVISELLSLLGVFSLLGGLFSVLFTGSLQSARYMELMTALLKGFMEITSGAQAIYNLKGIQLNIQLAVV